MYCMWNKLTQKQFSYKSYYQSAHHIMARPKLWMHRLWQLKKGFKDSAIWQGNRSQKILTEAIFTCYFRQSSQSFWEKMSSELRSTSSEPQLYGLPLVCVWFMSTNSIPWVLVITMRVVNTMSPFLYHKSLSIPWVLFNTMIPCQYHESMLIPWVNVYTISPCQFQEVPKGSRYPEGYLKVQCIQKVPKGPRYPKGT